ncbi:MAG: hypothetical protein ACTTJZ_07765 [Sphaerochaetaceae bacterium]
MNLVMASLSLMWKGMAAIFVVMLLIMIVMLILAPRKKGKDKC